MCIHPILLILIIVHNNLLLQYYKIQNIEMYLPRVMLVTVHTRKETPRFWPTENATCAPCIIKVPPQRFETYLTYSDIMIRHDPT